MPDERFDNLPVLPDTQLLPPEEPSFGSAEEEGLFQKTLPEFRDPAGQTRGGRWLLISLGLYALVETFQGQRGFDIPWLATLLGVILLHEMGHYFGMVLFGYRDVRIFFIPLFGAAAAGHKHAAPSWQQIIVLLLGPLPGIVLAGILYAFARPEPDAQLREMIFVLLGLNGFNLLPLVPLDGGRIVNLLFFSRHAVLELLFQLVAVIGLAGLGYLLDAWVLYVLAGLVLLPLAYQFQLRRLATRVRREAAMLPDELAELTQPEVRGLFAQYRTTFASVKEPNMIAQGLRSLHELAVTRSPRVLAALGFFLVYLAGLAAVVGVAVWMARDTANLQHMREHEAEAIMREAVQKFDEAARLERQGNAHPGQVARLRKEGERLKREAFQVLLGGAEVQMPPQVELPALEVQPHEDNPGAPRQPPQ